MASGFKGGGDFFNPTGIGGGGSQVGQDHIFSSIVPPRRTDMMAKRSFAELENQQKAALFRSVKQRNYYQHTSPISPLTPFDFSSTEASTRYAPVLGHGYGYGHGHGHGHGHPLVQQLRSQSMNPNNQINNFSNPNLSNMSVSQFVQNRAMGVQFQPDSEKKMRNQLQELEKQLLDDNDDEEGDVASVITGSEWSETMQNLIQNQNQIQKPFSPSASSSASPSSSSSTTTSSLICSSKQSLIDAATAISEGKIDVAKATLDRLNQKSNKFGDPEQRFTAHMVSALRSRINPLENPPPVMELCNKDHIVTTQKFYEVSPCFKLGFMAANLAILEATKDQPNNVHVVDFNIGKGNQYDTLIQALYDRNSGKPTFINLKITTVTSPSDGNEDELRVVGDRLKKRAEQFGVELKFNVVSKNICDLDRDSLFCEPNEALVVNFAFKLFKMPDESVSTENPRDELLRRVKGLDPLVVTLVEQEMNCNTAPFVTRLTESTSYYLALFDSLDLTMPGDGAERIRIEECLGRKATNSVACEGRDRLERCEVFGKWRARMGMAGFVPRPLGQNIAEPIRVRLSSSSRINSGLTIKEEGGGICFGWMGRVLTVASAWR